MASNEAQAWKMTAIAQDADGARLPSRNDALRLLSASLRRRQQRKMMSAAEGGDSSRPPFCYALPNPGNQLGALAACLSEINGSRAVPWMY